MANKEILNEFVDRLVADKGLTNLETEVLAQVKKDLTSRLEDRVNAALTSKLAPEKLEEFDKILDTAKGEEAGKFLQDNVPDFTSVVAQALLDFKAVYLGV